MLRVLKLWYFRYIKLRKLYKEEARLLKVMRELSERSCKWQKNIGL